MDWNWFFSSVAQSAAAIVGVFSAFIITKIINNQIQFNVNSRRINSLLIDSMKLKELASIRRIDWYSLAVLKKRLKTIEKELGTNKARLTAEEYYNKYSFPPFISKANIIKLIEDKISNSSPVTTASIIGSAFGDIKSVVEINEDNEIITEKNNIYSLLADIKHHVAIIKDFADATKINPESSPVIKWSIVSSLLLFCIGVIYPLSFLPLPLNAIIDLSFRGFIDCLFSIRGLILLLVSSVFLGINVYFLNINSKLKYDVTSLEELTKYTSLGVYAKQFETMENNANQLVQNKG